MRKVILGVAVSLDGFIEGPNGEYDWCFTDQDYGMSEFFKRVDSVFIGRKSYELSLGAEGGGDWMPKMKEYVFSRTLHSVKEGAELVSGDTGKVVERIKSEPGKDIWLFGGADLTRSFMESGLVDEISLAIHPILLGRGTPLFTGIERRMALKLLETKTYNTGLVLVRYELRKG